MSDFDMESMQHGFTLTENGDKSSPPISPPESVTDTSDYFSMLDIQDVDVKEDNAREEIVKQGNAKDDSVLDCIPKRGSVGLDITVDFGLGEAADLKTETVEEIFKEYGSLDRIVIDLDAADSKRACIKASAHSVSEALRIVKYLQGEPFDVDGFQGKLTKITQRGDNTELKFKKISPRQFDLELDECEYHQKPIKYDPRWYGRQYTYWSDYKDVMSGWPGDSKHVNKFLPADHYAKFPNVAEFWRDNCGADFPAVMAKLKKTNSETLKIDLDDFYGHLFTAILDQGMGFIPEWGLCDELAEELKEFKGFVIDTMHHRAFGSVMVVEYIPANFSGKQLVLESEGSDEQGSSSDEETGKDAKRPLSNVVSKDVMEATRTRLKTYATEAAPLYDFAACEWIYGMTVYGDKVFYTRMNRETAEFQFLNPQDMFVSSPYRRPLWQPVVTEKGYRRFQLVLNDMDSSLAAQ